jgi:hypothetical protein
MFEYLQYPDKSFRKFAHLAMHPLTVPPTLFMMPRTSLSPKSTNVRILKKKKTSKKELLPHKCSMIEGMHLASVPTCEISRLTQIPESTIRSTI